MSGKSHSSDGSVSFKVKTTISPSRIDQSTKKINSTHGGCLKNTTKPAPSYRTQTTFTNFNQENVGLLSQYPGFTSSESSNSKSFSVESFFDTYNYLKQRKCISSISKIINRDESIVPDRIFTCTPETGLVKVSSASIFSESPSSDCSSSFSGDDITWDSRSFLEDIIEEETNLSSISEHSVNIIIEVKNPRGNSIEQPDSGRVNSNTVRVGQSFASRKIYSPKEMRSPAHSCFSSPSMSMGSVVSRKIYSPKKIHSPTRSCLSSSSEESEFLPISQTHVKVISDDQLSVQATIDSNEIDTHFVVEDSPLNNQSSLDIKLHCRETRSTGSESGSVKKLKKDDILNSKYFLNPNMGNKEEKIVTFEESTNARDSEVNQSEADLSESLLLSDSVHSKPHDITFSLLTQSESSSLGISAEVHESSLSESSPLSSSVDSVPLNFKVNMHTLKSPTKEISAELHQSESNLMDSTPPSQKFDNSHLKIAFQRKKKNSIHRTQSESSWVTHSGQAVQPESTSDNLNNKKMSPAFVNAIRTRLNLLYDVSPSAPLILLSASSSNSPSANSGDQCFVNTSSIHSTGTSLEDNFQMLVSAPIVLRRRKYHTLTHISPKLLKLEEKTSEREVPLMCSKWMKLPTGTGVWKQVGPVRSDQVPCNQLSPGDYILEKNIDKALCSRSFADYSSISEKDPASDMFFSAHSMSSATKKSVFKKKVNDIYQTEASKLRNLQQTHLQSEESELMIQQPSHVMSLHKLCTSNPSPHEPRVSTSILQEVSPSSKSCIVKVKGNKIRSLIEYGDNSLSEVSPTQLFIKPPHVETVQKTVMVSDSDSANGIHAELHAPNGGCVKSQQEKLKKRMKKKFVTIYKIIFK